MRESEACHEETTATGAFVAAIIRVARKGGLRLCATFEMSKNDWRKKKCRMPVIGSGNGWTREKKRGVGLFRGRQPLCIWQCTALGVR